eukprot:CAMPEP_0197696434 /NCGR_PEP_ID=MMETSP1338-20131121/116620_1 /TAXON_ID=43686 ORGANISM="Pelagodinium beii, Strain RCC1491" /NCGR_SAMPLE_ID=MMETSP1338 /ASSEMBLY_ACC=CAM_ASM_000754 /LENGTH=49 /DNA_ID= /DNA_START= /DNA_END= /DNA_ORIENTATION=
MRRTVFFNCFSKPCLEHGNLVREVQRFLLTSSQSIRQASLLGLSLDELQ